jgi:acyl-CoA hydrolase
MQFLTRRLVRHENLNPAGKLFGGHLLSWIDEEAAINAFLLIKSGTAVTKFLTEVNFLHSAGLGDIVEIGFDLIAVGTTSITYKCVARNSRTNDLILEIPKIVFVSVDNEGHPKPHNLPKI